MEPSTCNWTRIGPGLGGVIVNATTKGPDAPATETMFRSTSAAALAGSATRRLAALAGGALPTSTVPSSNAIPAATASRRNASRTGRDGRRVLRASQCQAPKAPIKMTAVSLARRTIPYPLLTSSTGEATSKAALTIPVATTAAAAATAYGDSTRSVATRRAERSASTIAATQTPAAARCTMSTTDATSGEAVAVT